MECNFCKKTLSTKINLATHQKTAKYCLVLQGKTNTTFQCEHCNKFFTSNQTLTDHISHTCKKHKKKSYSEIQFENATYIKTINEKDATIIKLTHDKDAVISKLTHDKDAVISKLTQDKDAVISKLTQDKDAVIAKLEEKIDSLQKAIIEIASQPKTTHNNHNSNNSSNVTINNRFDIYNTKQIGDVLQKYLTKDVVARGQEGVAIMIGEYLLKGPNGEPLYECTDVARQKFEFINVDGNVETDPKATKLIRSINKSGLCEKTNTASDDLWTNTDGLMDHDKYGVYAGKITEIMMLENDSTKLRNKLASVTARQKGKKQ
uniref:C2H2-type domain-containing protein n=1 Tax=viral metagenome TaxID=1070528 RepID=A0A6C0KI56_9ZZZZ